MTPETDAKVTYGIWGLVFGAVIAMTIGFVWGGWTTSGTTQKMSEEAVLASRAAICVAQFMSAPNHKMKIKELQGVESYQRSDLIEKGGWDKMPGQEKAAWGVSGACVAGLEALIKTGA
ncbi:MAG: hypothetical protein ACREC3_02615 [Methyloceanibacter sp.]